MCVVWEVFSRSDPYPDHAITATAVVVASGKTKSLLIFPPNCPKMLVQLIHRCWDMNPDKRPSFQQMYPSVDDTLTQQI